MRMSWEIVSKALRKSRFFASTSPAPSTDLVTLSQKKIRLVRLDFIVKPDQFTDVEVTDLLTKVPAGLQRAMTLFLSERFVYGAQNNHMKKILSVV